MTQPREKFPRSQYQEFANITIIHNITKQLSFNFSNTLDEPTNYFNNSFLIYLSPDFISDMDIQGFKSFDLGVHDEASKSRTYLNLSEIGMKINPDYYDYLNTSFIKQLCNMRDDEHSDYRMC